VGTGTRKPAIAARDWSPGRDPCTGFFSGRRCQRNLQQQYRWRRASPGRSVPPRSQRFFQAICVRDSLCACLYRDSDRRYAIARRRHGASCAPQWQWLFDYSIEPEGW